MREPHILSPTKTVRLPKRVIFFDSEAEVDTIIHDEEIERKERREEVRKDHRPYMVCASFWNRTKQGDRERSADYYARHIRGVDYDSGRARFLSDFWEDVNAYTRVTEKTYVFAHNAKYDVQVTGAVAQLVGMGWNVVGFSDDNPFILEMEYYITHSPRTGKEYGEYGSAPDHDKDGNPVYEGKPYPKHRTPHETSPGVWIYPAPKVKSLILLSSTNYYQQSLKKLGEVFGLPKLDFDHGAAFDLETALVYCRRDVEILKTAMLAFLAFVQRENLGSFSITVAGQAFGAYRHRFMPEDTIHIHADERALRVERDTYAGGRTECFYMGEVPNRVYYVDVNSMYPYVMRDKIYPVELITFWENATVHQVKEKIMDDYLICCDARINTELPIYHKKSKRLIFPVGDFWTSLSTPELIRAMSDGVLLEVKNVAVYRGENIFEDYVNYFYSQRLIYKKMGDDVHDFLYKLFLNTLYGKFGQRNIKYEIVGDAPPDQIDYIQLYHADTRERETFKIFGGHVWKKKDDEDSKEAFNSFPAIAAHVTAYARLLLWDAIETAGRENVYYSDTDSLFCNGWGYQTLWLSDKIDNGRLGALKLEDYGTLELFGVKDYTFLSETKKDKKTGEFIKSIKIKGISKSAKQLPSSASGRLRFAVTQWGGFSDRFKNKNFSEYYNKLLIKELKREYNKGIVEGNKVTPYHLDYEAEQAARAKQEEIEYKEWLQKEVDDIFDKDYILTLCKLHGYIKVIKPGERYYGEYKKISEVNKMKYFRRARGMPIDEWCEAVGKPLNDFLDELINYK